jgi:exodeoxyribonuclease-5
MTELNLKFLGDLRLTEGQEKALAMVRRLTHSTMSGPKVGVLKGYAGTGKTTMLRVIAKVLGDVAIITPTGKAAQRVMEATGLEASTIHRWMYTPRENKRTREVIYELKKTEEYERPDSGLVIIDEASMVDQALWEDIQEVCGLLNCNILAVGDPFQLPPVSKAGSEPFSVLAPGFGDMVAELTEVLRQAQDSPIIRASMHLRAGRVLEASLELRSVGADKLLEEAASTYGKQGAVICYKNDTRHYINRQIRQSLGYGDDLMPGEPLLVIKNNKDHGRFNGEVVQFRGWDYLSKQAYTVYDRNTKLNYKSEYGRANIEGESGNQVVLAVRQLLGELDKVHPAGIEDVAKKNVSGAPFMHANLGYTLTCHKAQGSEWPSVLVLVESLVNPDHVDGRRWLYTAVTRASKDVALVWNVRVKV